MAVAQADAEFRARYSGVIDTLRAEHPGWIRDARTLHLPSHLPPWTDTGIELAAGEWFTALERRARCPGRTRVISVQGPAITSGVVGDGKIFRFGADTQTLAAGERGRLQIRIYHGTWASPDGTLATPHAVYDSRAGGIEVLVIRWGDVAPDEGLAALAFLAPSDRLIAAECTRLGSAHELPGGSSPSHR